jgi:hypothetical protein
MASFPLPLDRDLSKGPSFTETSINVNGELGPTGAYAFLMRCQASSTRFKLLWTFFVPRLVARESVPGNLKRFAA